MVEDNAGVQTLLPLRVELASPSNQWDQTWSMARQHMLGPSLTSFLFKLLHQILPTSARVSRILPNQSPNCSQCTGTEVDTLKHAFFTCQASQEAGAVLLNGLKKIIPGLTPDKILTLNFEPSEEQNFAITWCIAQFLFSLWQLRVAKKSIDLGKIRSEMEASCRLLRESRVTSTKEVLLLIYS